MANIKQDKVEFYILWYLYTRLFNDDIVSGKYTDNQSMLISISCGNLTFKNYFFYFLDIDFWLIFCI